MKHTIKAEMLRRGFVFLPEYLSGQNGGEAAASLGDLACLRDGHPVHQLVVKKSNAASPNTYSGIYGDGAFPFHSDLAHWPNPPRYLFLRCVKGFSGVPTMLIDSFQLVKKAGSSLLGRALVKPRRPLNGKLPLLRIYRPIGQTEALFRWDEVFLVPSGETGQIGMRAVRKQIATTQPISVQLANPGDTLLVDNWRMLHARASVPPGCETRSIERVYLGGIH